MDLFVWKVKYWEDGEQLFSFLAQPPSIIMLTTNKTVFMFVFSFDKQSFTCVASK